MISSEEILILNTGSDRNSNFLLQWDLRSSTVTLVHLFKICTLSNRRMEMFHFKNRNTVCVYASIPYKVQLLYYQLPLSDSSKLLNSCLYQKVCNFISKTDNVSQNVDSKVRCSQSDFDYLFLSMHPDDTCI